MQPLAPFRDDMTPTVGRHFEVAARTFEVRRAQPAERFTCSARGQCTSHPAIRRHRFC